jgi:hypothetical protein
LGWFFFLNQVTILTFLILKTGKNVNVVPEQRGIKINKAQKKRCLILIFTQEKLQLNKNPFSKRNFY